jgi:hypothetical protein
MSGGGFRCAAREVACVSPGSGMPRRRVHGMLGALPRRSRLGAQATSMACPQVTLSSSSYVVRKTAWVWPAAAQTCG